MALSTAWKQEPREKVQVRSGPRTVLISGAGSLLELGKGGGGGGTRLGFLQGLQGKAAEGIGKTVAEPVLPWSTSEGTSTSQLELTWVIESAGWWLSKALPMKVWHGGCRLGSPQRAGRILGPSSTELGSVLNTLLCAPTGCSCTHVRVW